MQNVVCKTVLNSAVFSLFWKLFSIFEMDGQYQYQLTKKQESKQVKVEMRRPSLHLQDELFSDAPLNP